MNNYNKLQTILLANSVYTMFAMMGFHVTMSCGTDDSVHSCDVTVYWDDENQLSFIRDKSIGLLRDGDGYEAKYHTDANLIGGWTDFEFFFE